MTQRGVPKSNELTTSRFRDEIGATIEDLDAAGKARRPGLAKTWAPTAFVTHIPATGDDLRVAIKDNIDIKDWVTSAGCSYLATHSRPAERDADCLQGVRAAHQRGRIQIVGKTVLNELAAGVTGANPWSGTPVNPHYPDRLPGGSSSGSAVAVAAGDADIAIGTDTGGSVRIPAAFVGVCGLKTTSSRVSTRGIRPLSPSLDSVGPLARTVQGLELGLRLLDPTFRGGSRLTRRLARFRPSREDPVLSSALDGSVRDAGFEIIEVDLPLWSTAWKAAYTILAAEAWANNRELAEAGAALGDEAGGLLQAGARQPRSELEEARAVRPAWIAQLGEALQGVDAVYCSTVSGIVPHLNDPVERWLPDLNTLPVNLAGTPALVLPVRSGPDSVPPPSLQLIGAAGAEAVLLDVARGIEQYLRT